MNNHEFGYGNADPGFHINIPSNNGSLPQAFQDDSDAASNFPGSNFQNPAEIVYQDHTTHPTRKEQNGSMYLNPYHHSQNDGRISEPSIYNMGVTDNNVYDNTLCSQDSTGQTSQSYCSEIQNQIQPFSNSQQNPHEAYIGNVSQSETFPSQYLPDQFTTHNMFPNELQPSVDSGSNAAIPINSTELVGASNTEYYPAPIDNSEADASMFTAHGDNLNMPKVYSEPLFQKENECPEADISRNSSSITNSSFGCPSPSMPPVDDLLKHCDNGKSIEEMSLTGEEKSHGCNTKNISSEDLCHSEAVAPELSHLEQLSVSLPHEPNSSRPGYITEHGVSEKEMPFDGVAPVELVDTETQNFGENVVSCTKKIDTPEILPSDGVAPVELVDTETQNFGENVVSCTKKTDTPEILPSEGVAPVELLDTETQNLRENVSFTETTDTPEILPSDVDSTSEIGNTHLPPEGDGTVLNFTGTPSKSMKGKDSPKSKEDVSNSDALTESLECITNSLEEGIEASKEHEDNPPTTDEVRALSPMITLMDGDFGEGLETFSSQTTDKTDDCENKIKIEESTENVRITRTKTGTPRNKTPRFIEEFGDSDDSSKHSVEMDEWEYEDGAELAPCKHDPSVTVHEDVLRVTDEELDFYKEMFKMNGVEGVLKLRLHCTACGRHIGAAPNYIHLGNRHKVLRVLTCNRCRHFYGIGQFTKDSDGSELYCRWCGQGGQVICCSNCPNVFCQPCIKRNFGQQQLSAITSQNDWACFLCNYKELWPLRAICWALLSFTMTEKKEALSSNDIKKLLRLEEDRSKCCGKKQKKRKQPTKHSGAKNTKSVPANDTHQVDNTSASVSSENIDFGDHFLFGASNFENSLGTDTEVHNQENGPEEDDYVDISQFLQSVLEEKSPNQSKTATVSSPANCQSRRFQPVAPRQQATQTVGQKTLRARTQAVGCVSQQVMTSSGPRIVIRQENLLRPGLKPINSQPNKMIIPSQVAGIPRVVLPGTVQGQAQKSKTTSATILNNMDGVRSMDQLQSLNQVPWFRDGIDSIRAVGFALNKRIRDLEARFHSLKNKKDIEKVMVLGKKLNRLTHKTDERFKQITSTMQTECREWAYQNGGDPYNSYFEAESDWNDEQELSKPLEKVMIPVSVAALQTAGIRPPLVLRPSGPPPLVRTSTPHLLTPRFPHVTIRPTARSSRPALIRGQAQPVQTLFRGSNSQTIRRQMPNPAARPRWINPKPNSVTTISGQDDITRVGAFINQRNGPNSVSISLTPPKRPRPDSDSDDDIQVCPTVPELLKMHNVKPCRVQLEKCEDFISTFLENQQQKRLQLEDTLDDSENSLKKLPVGDSHNAEAEATLVPSTFVSCGESDIFSINKTDKGDSDDEIEIIN